MELKNEDLRTVAQIGRSLWADPAKAAPITVDTVSAVTLQELTAERAVDKAVRAMLERAMRESMAENTFANLSVDPALAPFFRLLPEEWFILVALHMGRWSYARVARLAGISTLELEETVWGIRLRLGALQSRREYPIGSSSGSVHCPDYNPRRPWTQRFLDEEFDSGRERIFLQNHLMACDSCRRALNHARDLYYTVDAALPRISESDLVANLEEVIRENNQIRPGAEMTLGRSLKIHFSRPKVQWMLLALFVIALLAAVHSNPEIFY